MNHFILSMPKVSKENLIPLLEKYYESFIHEDDVWTFFLELAEYLELIAENDDTDKVVGMLNGEKERDLKPLNEIESKTIQELDKSKQEIIKRLKKKKITSRGIEYALEEIRAMEEGRVWTSTPKTVYIDRELKKLVEALKEEKKEDIVKDFKSTIKTSHYPVDDYIFSSSLREYEALRGAMHFKEKTTLWYVWDHLQWAYLVIKKSDETLQGIKEKKNRQEEDGFISLIGEMEKIQGYKDRMDLNQNLDPIWFKKDDFVRYARRFHKHVIKTLLENNSKIHHLVEDSPSFDASSGTLWIDGKPIKFGTKTGAYHCLSVMFQDPEEAKREWFFSEIAEAIDEAEPKPDKLIHNYFNNTIKSKIATETGIKDFFITTNQSVKINPDYIGKKS